MKFIKIFMLTVAAVLFASCSDDDETLNSMQTSVGFETEAIAIKESAGMTKLPIVIEGYRNGDVSVEIIAEGTGANPAKEGEHFRITDNTLSLLAENDTTNNATLYIEFQPLDDKVINDNREVTLTIAAAKGATVKTQKLVVTLRDNDAAFFEKFYGKWTLTGVNDEGKTVEKTINITGPAEETDPDYNNILWATGKNLFEVGVDLNFEWPMAYTFDLASKKGTISILCNQNYVATYGSAYKWIWVQLMGNSFVTDPLVAEWSLGEGDAFPTTIEWNPDATLVFYQPGAGWWGYITNLKMVQQ